MEWKSGEIFLETKQNKGGRSFPKEEGGLGKPQENGGLKKRERKRGQTKRDASNNKLLGKTCFQKKKKRMEEERRGSSGVFTRGGRFFQQKKGEGGHTSGVQKKEWVWSNEEKVFVKNKTRVKKKERGRGVKTKRFQTIFKFFFEKKKEKV